MMLTGDNGILTNAQQTSTQSAYKGAEEQVKIAYMAVKTEIMAKTVEDGKYNPIENTNKLANIVRKDLGLAENDTTGNGKWKVEEDSTNGIIKITYTDSKIDQGVMGTVNLTQLDGQVSPTVVPRYEGIVHYQINLLPTQDAKLYVDTAPSGGSVTPATPDPVAQTYTITYLANTGSGEMAPQSKTEGVAYTIAANSFTAPSGKVFKNWNTQADGEGTSYSAGATYSIDANLTLYAKWGESLTYGATANLGTVTVGTTALLKGWKYFYNDGTNIYLIYENYLENAQIPASTENGIATDGYNVYVSTSTYSGKTRQNLVDYLNDESTSTSGTWSGFAKGVQDALAAKEITVEVKAKGAPTLEQFAGSYQANYPGDKFDVAYRQEGGYIKGTSGNTVNAEGYVYKKNSFWAYYQSLGNSNKLLYFPETTYSGIRDANASPAQSTDTYGYCLAGLSASDSNNVCSAYYDGLANSYSFSRDHCGVRPVVSIPKSDTLMSKLGLN